MIKKKDKNKVRQNRHLRVRRKISGTAERPRLCVFRSNKHIYAQVIDDVEGKTLVAASTVEADIKNAVEHGGDKNAAKAVGEAVAKKHSMLVSQTSSLTEEATSTLAVSRNWLKLPAKLA